MITMDRVPVALRDGVPFAPDGIEQIAARLRKAFGKDALLVAERWTRDTDVRYQRVVDLLRTQHTQDAAR